MALEAELGHCFLRCVLRGRTGGTDEPVPIRVSTSWKACHQKNNGADKISFHTLLSSSFYSVIDPDAWAHLLDILGGDPHAHLR
jgi:hypothetical protein